MFKKIFYLVIFLLFFFTHLNAQYKYIYQKQWPATNEYTTYHLPYDVAFDSSDNIYIVDIVRSLFDYV